MYLKKIKTDCKEMSGKNASTMKVNRKKNNSTKRRRLLTNYTMPVISKTNIPKALAFIDYLKTLPIYILHAHSIPRSTNYFKKTGIPQDFVIPDHTFLLSLTQTGEFMCSSRYTTYRINSIKEEMRKYLHVHSADNVVVRPTLKSKSGIFGGIRRAGASSTYPNIAYGFKEPDRDSNKGVFLPPNENINGVYDITKLPDDVDPNMFINTYSIISQTEKKDDPDYMLKDIIQTVYTRTGIHGGIFILMGCLVTTNMNAMDTIGRQMDIANAEYTKLFETLTKDELAIHNPYETPYELGFDKLHVNPLSEEMALDMVKKGLFTKGNRPWIENVLPDDRAPLREKLKSIVVDPNFKV